MNREKLAENIQLFIPRIFKKLVKSFSTFDISKHQYELLFLIKKEDSKPMSYYSERMMIPKSNLTVMAEKLFEDGLIEREFDPNDRRVIILKITEKGDKHLCECKKKIRGHIVEKLALLSDEEIDRLNELIEEMWTIFNKVE